MEDLVVDERTKGLLKWILKKCDRGWKSVDWVHLTQERHKRRCIKCGKCLTSRMMLLLRRLVWFGFDLVWF